MLCDFVEDCWELGEKRRAEALFCLLQFNEYEYAKNLWEHEEDWKATWIAKKMGHWTLFHSWRVKQRKLESTSTGCTQKTTKGRGKSKAKSKGKCNTKTTSQRKATAQGKKKGTKKK